MDFVPPSNSIEIMRCLPAGFVTLLSPLRASECVNDDDGFQTSREADVAQPGNPIGGLLDYAELLISGATY